MLKKIAHVFYFLLSLQNQSRILRNCFSLMLHFASKQQSPELFIKWILRLWIQYKKINLKECDLPPGGFRNFRQLHARTFKRGSRIIATQCRAIFPSDGIIFHWGKIHKGNHYRPV